ncbi:MAG: hypothetical protein HDT41_00440 [Lachnospiraceae bacterium]|nr:hypothetical protein [Lachnospiraceae bacterium]
MNIKVMLFLVGFALFYWLSVKFRIFVKAPHEVLFYAVLDIFNFIKYKKWRNAYTGKLYCYFADFGGGKTLTMVHYVSLFFKEFNNKRIWDRDRKKWVVQKVHIISNVQFNNIPCEPLESLSQVVACAYNNKKIDYEHDTLTITYVVIDEASAQLNSRSFKTNIDPVFLNTLITCRHYHINLIYSSQSFSLVDALLRTVTQCCIWVNKEWRFLIQHEFNAKDMEYATNPNLLRPIRRTGFFITDKDYNAYDTLATVNELKKKVDNKDMMSEEEILKFRGEINPTMVGVLSPSRKYKRLHKKLKS